MPQTPHPKQPLTWKNMLRLYFTGATMGAADIVPGVSGGTVAFLLGVYEELIYSIKLVSGKVLGLVLKGKIVEAIQTTPLTFLIPLALGLTTSVFGLAGLISFLISTYPVYLWSLFFGLVLASAYVVKNRVKSWDLHDILALAVTAVGTYFLVGAVPVETPKNLLAIFLSGVIAICAMILPGISGSFLLVIMGKYEQIIGAIATRDFITLITFSLGNIVGLAFFSRVLSWLFAKHHDITVAILIGFMVGSLRKIWPWKEVLSTRLNSHGELVPLLEKNILPSSFSLEVMIALALAAIGFGIVLLLERLQVTAEQTSDIGDPSFEKAHKKAVQSQVPGKL